MNICTVKAKGIRHDYDTFIAIGFKLNGDQTLSSIHISLGGVAGMNFYVVVLSLVKVLNHLITGILPEDVIKDDRDS